MAAFELARDMHSRGFQILTACPLDSRLGDKMREARLGHIAIDARKYVDPAAVLRLRRAIREHQISNVVLHQLRDLWHIRPALIGFDHIRLAGFAHIFLSVKKKGVGHQWLYERMDDLICLTEIQKRNFAAHLPVPEERIHIVPNPVDMSVFRPERRSQAVRESLGARSGDILIGVIGRLDQAKGQMETVEAARVLVDAGLPVKIALVGEETLNLKGTQARLEQRIHALKLETVVRLTGYRSDTADIIASLDILAMPSWAETFGRVLLEAMASRTAIVATNAGGVPDIIQDGVDGLLVPPQMSVPLAEALRRLVVDTDLRARLAEAGYQRARRMYELGLVRAQLDALLTAQRLR
ncbi:MAG: glycosyltransferase family 4 protein [Bdellovibrionaceae bacterium]|nr:glycosyltransferase family 4 protein [Pseudobdellovibrionaceae bacterium]